ncbi:MAG TPA: hypothetical protein DD730_14360 [Desulfosporosinus sp.]|jgi:hypothetical protein|nr:hypothetical protein [Desulfosporosinus sp.]
MFGFGQRAFGFGGFNRGGIVGACCPRPVCCPPPVCCSPVAPIVGQGIGVAIIAVAILILIALGLIF